MMGNYPKENNVKVKDGTDVSSIMRDMMSIILEGVLDQEISSVYAGGGSLLVTPVFKESGEVEYYFPYGDWVHLLSGKVEKGGSWKKEVYDYMPLPLFVRENTIMLMGDCERAPDYDYTNNVMILIPEFEDVAVSTRIIPTQNGEKAATVMAERIGNKIEMKVSEDICRNVKKIGTPKIRCKKIL